MKLKTKSIQAKAKTRKNVTTVIASTATPDRYADVVAQGDAWDLESYKKNPVVVFGHRYDQVPIGRTTKLTTDKAGNLVASIEWDTNNPLGKQVADSFAGGFMSAVSVGFQPETTIERSKLPPDHPAHGAKGMYFAGKNTLLEISAVPVPANGEALAMRSLGHEVRHVMNVEETEDAYIVTYAKMPADDAPADDEEVEEVEALAMEDDEDEPEMDGYGHDDEDEDKEHEPGHDENDEEGEGEPDEDDEDDEDDEQRAKAMRDTVRNVVLELMGHDPHVRKALTKQPRKRNTNPAEGLADLFGIDI